MQTVISSMSLTQGKHHESLKQIEEQDKRIEEQEQRIEEQEQRLLALERQVTQLQRLQRMQPQGEHEQLSQVQSRPRHRPKRPRSNGGGKV
jgi:predicted RNase H-like nuclease (RuvC/YqgF family)